MSLKDGRPARYKNLEFWAYDGAIKLLDLDKAQKDEDSATTIVEVGEFMKRAIAVHVATGELYPSEVAESRRLLDDAARVCKEAKNMGNPFDAKQLAHKAESNKKLILGIHRQSERCKFNLSKPRTDVLLSGVEYVPDISL